MKISLQDALSKNFLKTVALPMLLVSVLLIMSVIIFRLYIFSKMETFEINKVNKVLETMLKNEQTILQDKLTNIESLATLLQKEHEHIFQDKYIRAKKVDFSIAKNGVYYKTTQQSSPLYYASTTKIGKEQQKKALFTENMDVSFKEIVDNNPLVISVYFNSYDNMSRYYPFIPQVYKQYGSSIHMQDYNFYYLADKKHNPKKKPIWTEPYLDIAGNAWMISCIVPIYSGEFLEGVTGVDITLSKMIERASNKQLPYDAKMMLINKSGTIIAMPDDMVQLTDLKELKKPQEFNLFHSKNKFLHEISQMISKNIDTKEIDAHSGSYTIFQKRLKDDSTLVLYAKKSMILESKSYIEEMSLILLLLFVAGFTLLLLLMYKNSLKYYHELSTQIAKPITMLSQISKDISTHNNLTVPKADMLEIDELSENFMKMLKELGLKNSQLEELNNSLAIKIEDATKELKEKNRLTNTLLDITMESIVISNEDHRIVQANQPARDMLQISNEEDLFSYHLFDFVLSEDYQATEENLHKKSFGPVEKRLYKKDKTIFPVLIRGNDILIMNKKYRVNTIIDLTEIKEKEKQNFQQSKLAQMGDMISMIAHQWRQPLNSISAAGINLSLLSDMGMLENEKLQESSEFIQEQCQVMSTTIDTFMNFVKPAKESKAFKPSHSLDAVMQIMGAQLKNHNIKVNIDVSDEDISIVGYEDLLEQVIINLLSNSRDAFDEIDKEKNIENKSINITTYLKGNTTVIALEDNAGGVAQEVEDKIFNPYFTTKEQGKGTGIGLYMSLDIMRKSFGGDLVFSAIDGGSKFEIICGVINVKY